MPTATPHVARPARLPARPLVALAVLLLASLSLTALAACGSSTVSRRVSFVETQGVTRFDTASITVTKGDTLKLTVVNRTDARQVFTVDELDVLRSVAPESAVTVDIEATHPGTYRVASTRTGVGPLSIVVPD